ncbi:MAG: hypothetical protein ACTSW4_06900 [Candidatus Ranarchaeia archaeon]
MKPDSETLQLWLKEIVERFSLMLGVMLAPLLERLQPEEMENLKKEVDQRAQDYYRRKFGSLDLEDRSLESFGKMMYNHLIGPLTVAGQQEAVIEKASRRLVTEAYKCVELDVWRQITGSPHLICELDAVLMAAMAKAFNPDLRYLEYSGPLKNGQIQWGLPWGKSRCRFIMEDVGEKTKK